MCSPRFHFPSLALVLAVGVLAMHVHRVEPIAHAQALGAQGKIAFSSGRDGNGEIYVMNADGTGVTRLTNDPANDREPAWSPDGSRIAFTSNRDGPFGPYDIYVMNADGTNVTRLTTTDTSFDRGSTRPAWCGNRIAFESDRFSQPYTDIFAMNEDGTGITRLTFDASYDHQPAWSPACDRIAFMKDPGGNGDVYVMNANGTGVTRLTNSVGPDQWPSWSPDGTKIAFGSTRDSQSPSSEIYVMDADGTGATRLTDDPRWAVRPVWSPDGSKLAFESPRDGDNEIYVMNADGSVINLTNNAVSDGDPAWSRASPADTDVWPNEPAGFIPFNDQPWDDLLGSWSWLRRGSSKDPDIVADSTAPFSPQNVLRMIFTPDMENGSEPSVHWIGLPGADEIYTAWWIKLSPNWTPGPSAAGQMTYLFAGDGIGQVSTGLSHPCAWPDDCNPERQGPPYKITANTVWQEYGPQTWFPNVAATPINAGIWHRIEFYHKWETTPGVSGDGIIRWWVDGTLNGDHRTVHYPSQRGFLEFQYAPTIGTAPAAEQHMYFDHTRVSGR